MYEPQVNLVEKMGPTIMKDDFSARTDLSIFTSVALELLHPPNERNFSSIETIKPLYTQSTVSQRSDQSSASSSCCNKSDARSH